MKTETKKVKLSEIKPNPDNPRSIKNDQMERLVKSLQEFPDMMEIREIVVDENMMILGGNMRYQAMKKLKEKQAIVKIVSGLSAEQKREFIVKDNASFGQWDFDILANKWDNLPLFDWGIKELESIPGNENNEQLEQKEKEIKPYKKIHILLSIDINAVDEVTGLLDELRKIQGIEIEQSAN